MILLVPHFPRCMAQFIAHRLIKRNLFPFCVFFPFLYVGGPEGQTQAKLRLVKEMQRLTEEHKGRNHPWAKITIDVVDLSTWAVHYAAPPPLG